MQIKAQIGEQHSSMSGWSGITENEREDITTGEGVPHNCIEHLHDAVPLRPERALPVGWEEAEEDALRHDVVQADILQPHDMTQFSSAPCGMQSPCLLSRKQARRRDHEEPRQVGNRF